MKKPYLTHSRNYHTNAILAVATLCFSLSAAAYCPPQYQENWVEPAFKTQTELVTLGIQAVDASLSAQQKINTERLLSALAVLTKQKALAAHQISDGSRMVAQQTAIALSTVSQNERVKQARFEFGGEFGQGYSPCIVQSTRQQITNRSADMAGEVRTRVKTEVTATPGRYADPLKARQEMIEAREDFCTQDQVNSGMCKQLGALPGADLTVATLFEPAMEGEKLYNAKVAFINNAVGLPDGMVAESSGKATATSAYALAKARKDAFVSPAIASLKQIQLDYSGVQGAESGLDLPLAMHFSNEVKRYAGNTEEYEAWSRIMAAQNERGALVELLKIQALKLAIQEKQYRQYERMEAQLAILVAMEAQSSGVNESVNRASSLAAQQTVHDKIQ